MASYPTAVKSFTTKNAGDTIQPNDVNDLQAEVNAIEAGLLNGTANLNSSNSTVNNLNVLGGSTIAGTLQAGASTVASLSVAGASTLGGAVVLKDKLSVTKFSTTLSGASTRFDNLLISSGVYVRIDNNSTAITVSGISGGIDGRMIYVSNANGAANITLSHNSGNSSADCRMVWASNVDRSLGLSGSALLFYDAVSGFWRGL